MTLGELLAKLPPTDHGDPAFPSRLLGAFRRKSITFCTGVTDETTVVYWFQSRTFTIDLRLTNGNATPALDRQGWIGDTLWDEREQQMSWRIERSYQPRDQWPEPARFAFMGNCALEFAPSGAYVEDWRQQSSRGPLLGLRLSEAVAAITGQKLTMAGGLVIAGEHAAYAQSRLPVVDDELRNSGSLDQATAAEIAGYEVSVATEGSTVTHSTQPDRVGQAIAPQCFEIDPDGSVMMEKIVEGVPCRLRFSIDLYLPDFAFDRQTPVTPEIQAWMERESSHLVRHAVVAR